MRPALSALPHQDSLRSSLDVARDDPEPVEGSSDSASRVNLHWDGELAGRFNWTAGPIIANDVVIVAGNTNGAGDGGVVKEAKPEDIRGFDVRTNGRNATVCVGQTTHAFLGGDLSSGGLCF